MSDDTREKLIQMLLKECVDTFRGRMKKEARMYASGVGLFPPQAVIVHIEHHQRYRGRGERIKAWLADGDSLREIPMPIPEINTSQRSGMYYSMGYFTFSLSDDFSQVCISMILGPRYGHGYTRMVDIIDDQIKLGTKTDKWIS